MKATAANARQLSLQPSGVVAVPCLSGFYCPGPNGTVILPCPAGHYCTEGTVTPVPCDGLSVCPAGSKFAVNFAAALLAVALTLPLVVAMWWRNRLQKAAERMSRATGARSVKVFRDHLDVTNAVVMTQSEPKSQNTGVSVAPSAPPSESAPPSSSSSTAAVTAPIAVAASEESATVSSPGVGIGFEFRDLSVSSDSGRIRILRSVSGRIPPSAITGILGPSGCGKSTLLSLLRSGGAGVDAGAVAVTLDGSLLRSNRDLARRVALVPQEDNFVDRLLTVRELLTFNARARRPHLTAAEVAEAVDGVLVELGLAGTADTIIGGGANAAANISGGQLKRVNVGMELVALRRPGAALLLDEFTSGIDSAGECSNRSPPRRCICNDTCVVTPRRIRVALCVPPCSPLSPDFLTP